MNQTASAGLCAVQMLLAFPTIFGVDSWACVLQAIIAICLVPGPDGMLPLHAVMKDQYGNYVVQKMLEVSCCSRATPSTLLGFLGSCLLQQRLPSCEEY